MKLKVITLNTWCFKFYDEVIKFFIEQQPDVILLQEVTSGIDFEFPGGISNGFERLRLDLESYETSFAPIWKNLDAQTPCYVGQAIFSKFPIITSQAQFYYKRLQPVTGISGGSKFPGLLLSNMIELPIGLFEVMTTHFIWSLHPETNDYQYDAYKNLLPILESKDRFILGGDFNLTEESPIIQQLSNVLIGDRPDDVKSTIHPTIHKVGATKELAVDYLFHKGDNIRLIKSAVPIVPISDHLPIVAEYEID